MMKIRALPLASCLVLGLGVGILVGLSESPVVNTVVQAFVALPAAVLGFVAGKKNGQALATEALDNISSLAALVMLGVGLGAGGGVWARGHRLLDTPVQTYDVIACAPTWPAGFCLDVIQSDLLLQQAGTGDDGVAAWRASVRSCALAASHAPRPASPPPAEAPETRSAVGEAEVDLWGACLDAGATHDARQTLGAIVDAESHRPSRTTLKAGGG